jgi:hypothetical protein
MNSLHAELAARPQSRADFARLAAGWLTDARRRLFPDLAPGPADGGALAPDPSGDDTAPWGPPGAVCARLRVQQQPEALGGTAAPYTDRAWRRMLAGLDRAYPFHVTLAMTRLGPDGRPPAAPEAIIAVHRSHRHPRWARFEAAAPASLGGWAGSPGTQRAWAGFVREQAIRAGADYGHVTDDANIGGTALERAIQGVTDEPPAVPRCRAVLRGYSWVTICAAELAIRLGGASALAASGAFDEVRELPGGRVYLRATAAVEDFEGAAVRRAFEALAPVLLPGRPDPERLSGMPARLVRDCDAGDFR